MDRPRLQRRCTPRQTTKPTNGWRRCQQKRCMVKSRHSNGAQRCQHRRCVTEALSCHRALATFVARRRFQKPFASDACREWSQVRKLQPRNAPKQLPRFSRWKGCKLTGSTLSKRVGSRFGTSLDQETHISEASLRSWRARKRRPVAPRRCSAQPRIICVNSRSSTCQSPWTNLQPSRNCFGNC